MMYELIIIGGGGAGLTAGLYAARAKVDTILLAGPILGGQLTLTDNIENYPGFPEPIGGIELTERLEKQAKKFGLKITNETAKNLKIAPIGTAAPSGTTVETENNEYKTKSIIIASGSTHRLLNVPGEKELSGKGVSYCATCDGPLFKNTDLIVAGGGDSALEEALFLTKFAKTVTIVHRRDKLRAIEFLKEKARQNQKISYKWNSVVVKIKGNNKVESVILENVITKQKEEIKIDGIFVAIGLIPNTDFCKDCLKLDENNQIITDENLKTNVDGIFAAGDVRKGSYRQIATAVGDGCFAFSMVEKYLSNQ